VVEDVSFLFSRSITEEKCERCYKFKVELIFAHSFRLESAVSQKLDKQTILISEGLLIGRSIKGLPKSIYGELVVILLEDRLYFDVEAFDVRVHERNRRLKLLVNIHLLCSAQHTCVLPLRTIFVVTVFKDLVMILEIDALSKFEAASVGGDWFIASSMLIFLVH